MYPIWLKLSVQIEKFSSKKSQNHFLRIKDINFLYEDFNMNIF